MTIDPYAEASLARRSFPDFCARMDSRFQDPAPFQRLLMSALSDLESGEGSRFLCISCPPRHSKTTIASVLFPLWALGRHSSSAEIVLASHTTDLAERNSRTARDMVLQPEWPFRAQLAKDSTAATRWHVDGGASFRALGCSSPLLGRGSDWLIVDDPIADASSEAECDSVWNWFTGIASNRLNKNARVVVISQRQRDTDLIGRILESESGSTWRVINLPAICTDEDSDVERVLGRRNGEALWPSQFSLAELDVRRQLSGSRIFEAMYQQDPIPLQGSGLIQPSWLTNTYTRVPEDLQKVVMSCDAAAKTGIKNDWSVLCVIGTNGREHYLISVIRAKVDYPGLKRLIQTAYEMHSPSHIYIESASNGLPVIDELKATTSLPIIGVTPRGSKIERVEAICGILEAGKLLLPKEAPWLSWWLREIYSFPNGSHDDAVDALQLGLSQIAKRKSLYVGAVGYGLQEVAPDYRVVGRGWQP
jgi:predicted phage terminase large subunit-like protein